MWPRKTGVSNSKISSIDAALRLSALILQRALGPASGSCVLLDFGINSPWYLAPALESDCTHGRLIHPTSGNNEFCELRLYGVLGR